MQRRTGSTPAEWEALQRDGSTYGGELDKSSTGCFHLSTLVQLDEELVFKEVDGVGRFPNYYGPSRTFSPLPLEAVIKAEKLLLSDAKFHCNLLN